MIHLFAPVTSTKSCSRGGTLSQGAAIMLFAVEVVSQLITKYE